MIEILVLMALSGRIGAIAQRKGYPGWMFKVLLVVLWFSFEIVSFFAAAGGQPRSGFPWPAYVGALVGAAIGGSVAFAIAHSLPARGEAAAAGGVVADAGARVTAWPQLFDPGRLGLNVLVGLTYLVAQEITQFTWMVPSLILGQGPSFNPGAYYLIAFVLAVVEAITLVAVVHLLRDDRLQPVVWGVVAVVLGIAFRAAFNLLALEGWPMQPAFAPVRLVSSFIYGVLLILGLVLAVRLWGARLWSLAAGAAGGLVLHALIFQVMWTATGRPDRAFDFGHLVNAALEGLIIGALIWLGVVWHLKTRNLQIVDSAIVPLGPAPAA